MTADPALVLAWLVLAHLAADFVLQTGWMARTKASSGGAGARALLAHGVVVAACLAPFVLAYGASGWLVLVACASTHMLVDWVKVVLTRRAEAAALNEARRRHEAAATTDDALGPAWTPLPGGLFALDQAVHAAVLVAAWAIWLAAAPLDPAFAGAIDGLVGARDPGLVHELTYRAVVMAALLIVNVRAAALFVAVLVGPRLGAGPGGVGGRRVKLASTPAAPVASPPPAARPSGWTLRLGPLSGRVVPDPEPRPTSSTPATTHPAPAPPARVGEAIGILERLLIVTFVLVGAEAAIGLVIAAKTLARFRQLDDRDFAEYYLLGTLASVAIAVVSAFIAEAALQALA